MSDTRRIGVAFGLLGGALFVLSAFIVFVLSIVVLALGHFSSSLNRFDDSVILLVVGLVVLFFSLLSRHGPADRAVASGVVLILLAAVVLFLLPFSAGLLALLGAIFTLIAGVLLLVSSAA